MFWPSPRGARRLSGDGHALCRPLRLEVGATLVTTYTRAFAIENSGHPVVERRIYRMAWRHERHKYESTVGKPDVRLGEEGIAILEGAATYLVCTPNRGVVRGFQCS